MSLKGKKWRDREPRLCQVCGDINPLNFVQHRQSHLCAKCWRLKYRDSMRRSVLKRKAAEKIEAFRRYGPNQEIRCSWPGCDVTDPDMLALDHIQDDGAAERKSYHLTGWEMYRSLKKRGYPDGYQTLCCNHNQKKEILRARQKAGLWVEPIMSVQKEKTENDSSSGLSASPFSA